ncbi:epoxide hydrolase N-terminal domain-containing protein [Kribbella sp. NPDC048915]|uniref:epoxide hydrolase N-terminal domain-containing protein n=1 Tax=Kribbella sp. NPDC048915 TaxID=3155148 RepID=UPI0033EEB9E2
MAVPDENLDDLRRRLRATKWPRDAGNDAGFYGVPRTRLQRLVEYCAESGRPARPQVR